ncbi:MAG: cysteine--tRNA ligase [Candidatus Sericytochromatia bacterium]|nr:cysteine--tRNA ligase [Candidatus Tanganyikabacteria bacterium]
MLRVFNDLTKRIEPFEPIAPPKVAFYACGVTVYDLSHLGHARSYTAWDVVRRYLLFCGYDVRFIQNFTDIDDKIIRRAGETGEDPAALTWRFEEAYFADMDRLSIMRADLYPRATEHVVEMQEMVRQLLDGGHAYVTPEGSVYFRVRSFPEYGKLSGRSLDVLSAQTRLDEPDPDKEDPADFALWKAAKPGEPWWDSPWGKGRPGWHLECSAMVYKHLGATIDIHTGGMDLIFPHHENEIAQSEACTGVPMARYWLHNGFVNVDSEKMAKSLGNFKTIRDLLAVYDPQDVRYFLLQTHYRQDFEFAEEALRGAGTALGRLRRSLAERDEAVAAPTPAMAAAVAHVEAAFREAMDDDFNTPRALAALWDARAVLAGFEGADRDAAGHLAGKIRELGGVLGLDLTLPEVADDALANAIGRLAGDLRDLASRHADADLAPDSIGSPLDLLPALISRRARAKQARDFATADAIRDGLKQLGIALADKPGGLTAWELAPAAHATPGLTRE